jgi:hypothetical protein
MATKLTVIGNEPRQEFDIYLDNGEIYSCLLEFISENLKENDEDKIGFWVLTLTYNNIKITQRKLSLVSNILETHSNILPYGIAIISDYDIEPRTISCFSNELTKIYIVTYEEIKEIRGL